MPHLTRRGQVFGVVGLALAVIGMVAGYGDITRMGLLLLLLPALAAVLVQVGAPTFSTARSIAPLRLAAGERGTIRLVCRNDGRRTTPAFLASEGLDSALGEGPKFVLGRVIPGGTRRYSYPVRASMRGRYSVGHLAVARRDPFGLAYVYADVDQSESVLVLPHVEALTSDRAPTSGRGSEGSVPHMVALHGEDDSSIRAYRVGDDLRRVHWRTTAHRGELMVRQEDRPTDRRAVLVLDHRASGHQGSGPHSSHEWAVTAVASMGSLLLRHGCVTHLVTHESATDGTAAQSLDTDRLLSSLAVTTLAGDEANGPLLSATHSLTSQGGLTIAVCADYDENFLRSLAAVREPGDTAALVLLDTGTFVSGSGRAVHRRPATELTAAAEAAGWNIHIVQAGTPLPDVWARIQRSSSSHSRAVR